MPANLTPDYKKAEQWFRSAATEQEKIDALEEMLRVIPKHKGTEHLQADIKRRLSRLRDSVEAGRKKAGRHTDVFYIPRTGAGQVALIGTPNSGKSSIVGAVSHAKVTIADYPFATTAPVPGMMKYEDISIELVDMPPITADYSAPGQVGTYRNCDIIGIVVDLSADVSCQMTICLNYLESHRLIKKAGTDYAAGTGPAPKKAVVIYTKTDSLPTEITDEVLRQYCPYSFASVTVSSKTGRGLERLKTVIFETLDIVRVYAKKPGKEPDMAEPFTLPAGSTVYDLACQIHREVAEKLKSARCRGQTIPDGRHVQRNYVLHDKDIIELHFQ